MKPYDEFQKSLLSKKSQKALHFWRFCFALLTILQVSEFEAFEFNLCFWVYGSVERLDVNLC
jgi:hypothetical protein